MRVEERDLERSWGKSPSGMESGGQAAFAQSQDMCLSRLPDARAARRERGESFPFLGASLPALNCCIFHIHPL